MIISNRLKFPREIEYKLKKSNSPIFITGVSGWLGMALLEMCESCFGDQLGKRVRAFASKQRAVILRSGRIVNLDSLELLSQLVEKDWLLCHFAFLGKEKITELGEEKFIDGNNEIRSHIDLAIAKIKPSAIFYASSGAVYDSSNLYGNLKAKDEKYFKNLDTQIVIARIFNLSGPYINKWQNYALSSLIMDGFQNQKLTIQSTNIVIRSYTYIEDVLSTAFEYLTAESCNKTFFDTAGLENVELQKLAEIINEVVFNNKIPIIRYKFDPKAKSDLYVGNKDVMIKTDLSKQIYETAEYLKTYGKLSNN